MQCDSVDPVDIEKGVGITIRGVPNIAPFGIGDAKRLGGQAFDRAGKTLHPGRTHRLKKSKVGFVGDA